MATQSQTCALIPLCLRACSRPSTTVEKSLQISPFLTNKANFRKSQMNVSILSQKAYKNNYNWTLGENKPNSNPIQSQSNPIKANKMSKQTQYKPNQTQFQRQKNRFLLTKQAFFYSIEVLETTIYNRLLFLSLAVRNRRFHGKNRSRRTQTISSEFQSSKLQYCLAG
jgi:hypothetical protein